MNKKLIIIAVFLVVLLSVVAIVYLRASSGTNNNALNSIEGLEIKTLKDGGGEVSKIGDTLTVHYRGVLEDGTEFDSSIKRGNPFSFTLGQGRVILGWELGLLGMREGEKREIVIAPELGYGKRPAGSIPPNSTLIFEIELLEIRQNESVL